MFSNIDFGFIFVPFKENALQLLSVMLFPTLMIILLEIIIPNHGGVENHCDFIIISAGQ
jgi:hypothetical protein